MHKLKVPLVVLLALAVLLVLGALLPLGARPFDQEVPELERLLARAERDWDTGHYIDALEAAEALLTARGGERYVRQVAQLTGEVYHTDELTADGRLPAISPRGRYASYATGTGPDAVTRVVDLANGFVVVTELPGAHRLVFAPAENGALYVSDGSTTRVALPGGTAVQPGAPPAPADVRSVAFGADGGVYAVVGSEEQSDVWRLPALAPEGSGAAPERLTETPGAKADLVPVPQHGKLVYRGGDGVRVFDLGTRRERAFPAAESAVSADGSTLVFSRREGGEARYFTLDLAGTEEAPRQVFATGEPTQALAVSPGGARFAFQVRLPENNREIFAVTVADGGLLRVTNEPQHDFAPHFLSEETLYALKGEARNRRIFHYDLRTGESFELFLNNTVRTIEPQTEWLPSADGTRIIIRADRDGNTVSPEQGIYVTNLTRPVTQAEALARVRAQLASERDLRARGERMFAPIAERVRAVTGEIARDRLSGYLADLVGLGPRNIADPANAAATEWVAETFRAFGYEPEYHWFEAQGRRLANVIATVLGTENPELVYVVAAHFDTVRDRPGADDDASGIAVILEAARVLKDNPQPATILFLASNGEESGLLGARAWVRDAAEAGVKVQGLFNHEVLGWTRHHRLDNTVRHNNHDLADLTHAAAFLFTRMITYESFYVRSTDAVPFHQEWGPIVTALAGHPLLGNPHYHQATDEVRTIDMQLVAEASRTTTASVMLMASSPAMLRDLELERQGAGRAEIRWTPGPERGVVSYTVVYGPADNPEARTLTVTEPRAALEGAAPGTRVKVRANNDRGLHGWGWSHLTIP